ncbi:MAG: RNA-binding cell elongation regulator Jag/EloR [bacterium]
MTEGPGQHPPGSGVSPASPDRSLDQIEVTGRTVNEAIESGLASLGVDRSRVDVDVLGEGSRGVLGLGARGARVRLTVRFGIAETAGAIARDMLALMGISANVTAEEGTESIRVRVEGADVGSLIGKHGQTLGAAETLLALMAGRKAGAPIRVELDAEGYRDRRVASLEDLARRTAERVARQRREIALVPMGPRDRRVIHVTLQDDPKVSTVSRGERDMRRVVIVPKDTLAAIGTVKEEEEGSQPGAPRGLPLERGEGHDAQPGSSPGRAPSRSVRPHGASRPGSQRRRPGSEGQGGRRSPNSRQGIGGGFGRRSQVPGQRPTTRSARPDGLPVDEELEAEIEAYLAKTTPEDSRRNPAETDAPDGPKPLGQDDLEDRQ